MTTRLHRHRLPRSIALLAVAAALLIGIIPVSAEDAPVRLTISPVGEDHGSFFTITADPGEILQLEVELGNAGAMPMEATTFAADTFTMPNGGFGINELDDQQSGTTGWVTYPTQSLTLNPDQKIIRAFSLAIPADTQPGDYLTSLVIQNTEPIQDEGSIAVNQIVRQAVAIAIDVPGPRTPALGITSLHHDASGGQSVIVFDVNNTGNTHLKPDGAFALHDSNGTEVDRRTVTMDRFYSHTQTTFSIAMDGLLAPGTYYASLTLTDPKTGATAHIEEAPVTVPVVEVPPVLNTDGSVARPAQTNAPVEASSGPSIALLGGIAGTFLVLGIGLTIAIMRMRSRHTANSAQPTTPVAPAQMAVAAPVVHRPGRVKPLIPRADTNQGSVPTPIVQQSVSTDIR